jgi:hypothetical protein
MTGLGIPCSTASGMADAASSPFWCQLALCRHWLGLQYSHRSFPLSAATTLNSSPPLSLLRRGNFPSGSYAMGVIPCPFACRLDKNGPADLTGSGTYATVGFSAAIEESRHWRLRAVTAVAADIADIPGSIGLYRNLPFVHRPKYDGNWAGCRLRGLSHSKLNRSPFCHLTCTGSASRHKKSGEVDSTFSIAPVYLLCRRAKGQRL